MFADWDQVPEWLRPMVEVAVIPVIVPAEVDPAVLPTSTGRRGGGCR